MTSITIPKTKTKTTHISDIFDQKFAESAYIYLQNNIKWKDGIYSKAAKQVSRLGATINETDKASDFINNIVLTALQKFGIGTYIVLGTYLNYYKDGNDFCPNHSHTGTCQLIISFGASRPLTVGTKQYILKSGDAILFGSSVHGIPKDTNIKEGRISIAVFMKRIEL
jgi:hypothetical protein